MVNPVRSLLSIQKLSVVRPRKSHVVSFNSDSRLFILMVIFIHGEWNVEIAIGVELEGLLVIR